jgi:hypothetical protein
VSVSSDSNGPFVPGQSAAFLGPGVGDVPSRGREHQSLPVPSTSDGILILVEHYSTVTEKWTYIL